MNRTTPESIEFSNYILSIPALAKMGISEPIAGLGLAKVELGVKNSWECKGMWINRGETLLSYNFSAFPKKRRSIIKRIIDPYDEPNVHFEINITSPVSGLILFLNREASVDYGQSGLRYERCEVDALPVILLPKDEPQPDNTNFTKYDRLASWLMHYFYLLPMRDRSEIGSSSLAKFIEKSEHYEKRYSAHLKSLQNRNPMKFRGHFIRELNKNDQDIVSSIQNLRAHDIVLRKKLVHIARLYGDSIT